MSTTFWVETSLGEVAEVVGGATPKTSVDEYWDGDIYWATPKDLSELEGAEINSTPRTLTKAGLRSCSARVLPPGSVLLSSRAPIGHVAINTVPMATNQGFKSLIPDPVRVDAKFLYWWLRRNRPALEAMGTGATFKEISKKTTAAVRIQLPPIEEQRRIVAVLDAADALRTKRREALAKLDTLTQAIFIDMFGHPASGADRWSTATLGELTQASRPICYGVLKPGPDVRGGVPLVRIVDLDGGQVRTDGLHRISNELDAEFARSRLAGGEVLLSIQGTIGRVAICPPELAGANISRTVAVIRTDDRMTSRFLATWLSMKAGRFETTGSTRSSLNIGTIRAMRVPVPPKAEQVLFQARLDIVDRMQVALGESRRRLDELFASAQHRAFRGEL